jgi:hypothetical protein
MAAAQKKLETYFPRKGSKVPVPARIYPETVKKAQAAAKKLGVPLCDFVEGAINMACDRAVEK